VCCNPGFDWQATERLEASLEKRRLGKTDIQVSRLGLGCVAFGREIDEVTSSRLMSSALDFGITLIDTAEAYGGGQARQYRRNTLGVDDVREASCEMHSSEKIVGRWLKASGNRSRVVLQTKVTTSFTKQHVQEAIDASLERLQTDWIDLYLFHSFDAKTALEEGLEALTRAVEQGKIRVAGCSNFSAVQLRESLAISSSLGLQRLEEVQPPYSLVERTIESDLLPLCAKEQIAVVSYSPLGAGFLSGKYERGSVPKGSRFDVIPGHADIYFTDQKFAIVERLRQKSAETGHSMVRLAMGWVLKKQGITSVLVGASGLGHLENAIEAMEMDFPDEWVHEMDGWRASSERSD
jgi:aryl-alcohol dehydrogenase-like predicted oxidoreductase